ncbi:hypothetical protein BS17DRAFT_861025 [Gyrodon lividus]|nr:hypothetical protein BS17DRAFT_861025 [Gyrodon lividus]
MKQNVSLDVSEETISSAPVALLQDAAGMSQIPRQEIEIRYLTVSEVELYDCLFLGSGPYIGPAFRERRDDRDLASPSIRDATAVILAKVFMHAQTDIDHEYHQFSSSPKRLELKLKFVYLVLATRIYRRLGLASQQFFISISAAIVQSPAPRKKPMVPTGMWRQRKQGSKCNYKTRIVPKHEGTHP